LTWLLAAILAGLVSLATGTAQAQIELPQADMASPIAITADVGFRWTKGVGVYETWILSGNVLLRQGLTTARAHDAVVWIDRTSSVERGHAKAIVYLEGNVVLDAGRTHTRTHLSDRTWLGGFYTDADIEVHAAREVEPPAQPPAIYQRAMSWRPPTHSQDQTRAPTPVNPEAASPLPRVPAPTTRRIRLFARSDVPVQAQWEVVDRATNRAVAVVESGVNVIIDGTTDVGSIDLSADRLVLWTVGVPQPGQAGETYQNGQTPLEVYMEGNIIFRQGDHVINAQRMYYDVNAHIGVVLDAELLTPVPNYEGLLRLRAAVIRQTSQDTFFAEQSFFTSSRLGEPGYRMQSSEVFLEDHQVPVLDPRTGDQKRDPLTDQPLFRHQREAIARNDVLFIGDIPVFYWPYTATDLEDSHYFIRRFQVGDDSIFGWQIKAGFDGYQLLGIKDKPDGTDLGIDFGYLGKRGFAEGGTFKYARPNCFDIPGQTNGILDFYGIPDHGRDNLGGNRGSLLPEPDVDYRYRLFWEHREMLPDDFRLSAEVGFISDRNFLQEYFQHEWDELKDENTRLELKQTRDDWSWSISTSVRLNDFFTETQWLPRLDHDTIGQSLLGDWLTWYEHSAAGYGQFRVASPPSDPHDKPFVYLPWEINPATVNTPQNHASSELFTCQELDLPLQLGPVKVVPYALGQLAHWDQDLNDDSYNRAYGQVGLRASVPFWSVDPSVQSDLLNVNGIAHKVVLAADFSYSSASRSPYDLPLYNPLNDESIEAFQRRFESYTFGGPPLPLPFDERNYALRAGLGDWVTSPTPEIVGDITALRLDLFQRWQTKRGPPDNPHIIDYITFDTQLTLFPDRQEDFGSVPGLLDYDFRWHIGDRLTLVSDGEFDFFDQGEKAVSIGGFLTRPPRGSLYLGFRYLDGPVHNEVIVASYSYLMSPNWITTAGISIDLTTNGTTGMSFTVTRIGESFLISAGFNANTAQNNVGFMFNIEPRFLPKTRLGQIGGASVPPAGARGLE
jgi:lipopolysaccharide export system protein LptA